MKLPLKKLVVKGVSIINSAFLIFPVSAIDNPYLRALAEIESNNNDLAIGKHCEVSRYQITPETWYGVTQISIALSTNQATSAHIAESVLRKHIERFINKNGTTPNTFDIYCMWNLGYHGYAKREFNVEKCPRVTQRNVIRFNELVKKFEGEKN